MTLTPKKKNDYALPHIYHGKTIGPVCGRIKNGQLFIEDKEYVFPVNEGENTLHGGPQGFSTQLFDYSFIDNGIRFIFKDENGQYIVEYHLNENTLKVDYFVNPKKEIPLSLTNHSYFTLGKSNNLKNKLTINASTFIEVNKKDLIPERIKIVPTCLDFKKARNINRCINNPYLQDSRTKGYDHSFILDEIGSRIIFENNRYQLSITSSFKAVQIYSDNYEDGIEMLGTKEKIHRGVAIEPQDNQLERKTYTEPYHQFIEYTFIEK